MARLLTLGICGLLAACAVGPNYRPPATTPAEQWSALPGSGIRQETPDAPTLAAWWRTLDDPLLDGLVARAVEQNTTVRQARARVLEARARRAIIGAGFAPAVSASGGLSRSESESRFSADPDLEPDLSDENDELYFAGLDASWELDLFGGQRRAFEAARAQLQASEADLRDVLVTLLGDVALSYLDVRTTQARLEFARRNLAAQRETLDIARWRGEAGLATALDVEQARSSFEQTRAQIPALESALAQSIRRLEVLTAQGPGSLTATLQERRPIPAAPLEIVVGVPADLLRRRPDIRAAERRLAAQSAQIGVATAALYPSLSLSGSINLQALSAADVLDGFRTERAGLGLSVPLFRGGALRQNVAAQRALFEEALASYDATIALAFEEVENALTAWVNEQRRHEALMLAVESARRAAELALMQYNSGLVDFQVVLTADRQLIALEDALAISQGELTANLIRLYKALGGGWSVFPDP